MISLGESDVGHENDIIEDESEVVQDENDGVPKEINVQGKLWKIFIEAFSIFLVLRISFLVGV